MQILHMELIYFLFAILHPISAPIIIFQKFLQKHEPYTIFIVGSFNENFLKQFTFNGIISTQKESTRFKTDAPGLG